MFFIIFNLCFREALHQQFLMSTSFLCLHNVFVTRYGLIFYIILLYLLYYILPTFLLYFISFSANCALNVSQNEFHLVKDCLPDLTQRLVYVDVCFYFDFLAIFLNFRISVVLNRSVHFSTELLKICAKMLIVFVKSLVLVMNFFKMFKRCWLYNRPI